MVIELGMEAYAHYPIIQEKNQHKIKSMLGYTWSSRPAWALQQNSVSKGKVIEKYELSYVAEFKAEIPNIYCVD